MADSSQGGLMGMLGGIDPSLLMNLGMGLMAGSKFGSNAGEGLMQGMQNYQSQRAASQDYQIKAYQLQRQKAMNDMLSGLMGPGQSGAPQTSDQSPSLMQSPSQAAPNASAQTPSGAQPSGQSSAGPAWLTPPDVGNVPIGGMNAKAAQLYSIMNGKDPLQAASEVRTQQQAIAQQQVAPALAKLDTVIKSAKPSQYVAADPELAQAWSALAPHAGFDPVKDMNDDNLRSALTLGRNQLSAAVGKDPLSIPPKEDQIRGPLGAQYSRDPITGKVSQEIAPQETAQFTMPDGSVKMLTKAQGMAQGLSPFNPTLFSASNMSDQAIQAAADTYRTTGKVPPLFARNPVAAAKVMDRAASDMTASGDTAGAIAARAASLKANGQALDQVTKLETATKGYAATLDKNLQNLTDAYAKAGSSGSPLLTRAQRIWQQGGTGDPATASMVTWLNAVQGEYAKLKSGNLGNAPASDSAMRDAKEVINKYMNQGGIAAVREAMTQEAQNRLSAIGEQKTSLGGALGTNAPGSQPPVRSGPPAARAQPGASKGPLGIGQSQQVNGFTVTRTQ